MSQVQAIKRAKEHPFAKSRMAQFLNQRIESLKGVRTQRDISDILGYKLPNIVSMFKNGETKVPLDKIPALAKALDCDVSYLVRLGLEQYWPGEMKIINQTLERVVTANEMELVKVLREETNDTDPRIPEEALMKVRKIAASIK